MTHFMQEIAEWAKKTKEEVERSVGDANSVVRITRNTDGDITDVQYGAEGRAPALTTQ
jgi:hypothetical protein